MTLCEQYTFLNYSFLHDPKCVVLSISVALLIISSLLSGWHDNKIIMITDNQGIQCPSFSSRKQIKFLLKEKQQNEESAS